MARKPTRAPKTRAQKDAPPAPAPFDRLRRDRTSGDYSTEVSDRGHEISVRFVVESKEQLQALLPIAVKFWRSRTRWFKAYREYAVEELLTTLNDFLDCGEDDPPVVTAGQLRRSLKVPFSVDFFPPDDDGGDPYFIISGGDDALREHCVEATGNLEDGFTEGEITSVV